MTDTRDFDDEPMTDDELQSAAAHIAERFEDHDIRFLALMSPQQRAEHKFTLRQLYKHVDNIWQAPKQAGEHPVDLGGYGTVAGLRDLLAALISHVEQVQADAGDPEGGFLVRMVSERVD